MFDMPDATRIPGLVLTDHYFTVPLNHARPDGETITVFARQVVAPAKEDQDLPWLVFLQGGPGSAAPRPQERSGWLKRALQHYRVLLFDQRGTGLSTPVLPQTLARFEARFGTAAVMHSTTDHPGCLVLNTMSGCRTRYPWLMKTALL